MYLLNQSSSLLTTSVFSVLLLSVLTACGNKGPLYLPDAEVPTVSMTPTTPPAAATMKDEDEQ